MRIRNRGRSWVFGALVALLFQVNGCKKKEYRQGPWYGIPDERACAWDGHSATCIAEGHAYTCVRDNSQGCDGDDAHAPVSCAQK